MAVAALGDYTFEPADAQHNFHGKQLLYIGWDAHLMFCAPFCLPLPPDLPFGALVEQVLPGVFGQHPDFARIDWAQVRWLKSGQPWQPDPARSLAANGLGHKDVIRFSTPGLTGIQASCS
jgi:phenol/toluene 2-monooxygenase (NADH) P4/A4